MTALEAICARCQESIRRIPSKGDHRFCECPYRDISNDHCPECDILKEKTDALDILLDGVDIKNGPSGDRIVCDVHPKDRNDAELVAKVKREYR